MEFHWLDEERRVFLCKNQSVIRCPYCGHEYLPQLGYELYQNEKIGCKCGKCRKSFVISASVEVKYTSMIVNAEEAKNADYCLLESLGDSWSLN